MACLGTVTAWRAGVEIDLGWARQRTVLAVLLGEMNRSVSTETIIDAVWGEQPPRDARRAVQTNVSRLRSALQPDCQPGARDDVLLTTDAGYLLRGSPSEVDTMVFERHLTVADDCHRSGALSAAATEIEQALALWRGQPFGGLSGAWVEAQRAWWCERRLDAIELRITIELDRDQHTGVIAELTRLVREFPLRESLRELVMIALYRSGRQADAIAQYHDLRQQLAEQLGIDPGRRSSRSTNGY